MRFLLALHAVLLLGKESLPPLYSKIDIAVSSGRQMTRSERNLTASTVAGGQSHRLPTDNWNMCVKYESIVKYAYMHHTWKDTVSIGISEKSI
jgi:hypothetical protein